MEIERIRTIVGRKCLANTSLVAKGCRRVFDGLYCWPETEPGALATQNCTNEYWRATNKDGLVTKQCNHNSTWFVDPDRESGTNFSQCGGIYIFDNSLSNGTIDPIYETWLPIIKDTAYVGYSVSILSLAMALAIFVNIKRLHCERNKLHVNLFLSFVMRALMFILKDALYVRGTALRNDATYDEDGDAYFNYSWLCRILISVRYYFILSNFTFMLMEGLYLHNLIFLNLFSENHGTTAYCVTGWALPALFITSWMILRALFENTLCWTQKDDKHISLLIDVPVGVTVVINFILFIIIVRVLVLKLHFTSTFIQQRKKYRKLLKSTLILIPLFGIPYILSLVSSFYVHRSKILEVTWLFFDQTFTAFQGLFAALVYCLLNSEVQIEIKRKYCSIKEQNDKEFRRSRTISCNTQQFSLQTNDEPLENVNLFGMADYEPAANENRHK
ncbi:parathyroid hormone/parathyroid hormone-related peptide receptor-like [Cylas formicarius]|uniref:parathyroid hormone/parathyroid hormone-related peptide receptor-like n=1 Tax=Cylas formicarius TaxID=197179 RepID=UPI002958DEC4|nr:parathyroid hormone/parathyroid hormone-related peptide receptor-like [Cylas formicarius]